MRNRLATTSPDGIYHIRFNRLEREHLRRLADSTRLEDRVLCVDWLEAGHLDRSNVDFVIEVAEQLARDRRTPVRWRVSAGILQRYAEDYPGKIWPLIVRLGASRSVDLRWAVAVCMVELLLEHHYAQYFPKVKALIEAGDRKMLDMLAMSYHVGQAAKHLDEIDALLVQHHASVIRTKPKRQRRGSKTSQPDPVQTEVEKWEKIVSTFEELDRVVREAIAIVQANCGRKGAKSRCRTSRRELPASDPAGRGPREP
jgi:hypothetical protein